MSNLLGQSASQWGRLLFARGIWAVTIGARLPLSRVVVDVGCFPACCNGSAQRFPVAPIRPYMSRHRIGVGSPGRKGDSPRFPWSPCAGAPSACLPRGRKAQSPLARGVWASFICREKPRRGHGRPLQVAAIPGPVCCKKGICCFVGRSRVCGRRLPGRSLGLMGYLAKLTSDRSVSRLSDLASAPALQGRCKTR